MPECSCKVGRRNRCHCSWRASTPSGPPAPSYSCPFQLSVLGDAYTQAGRFEEAHAALDEGLALAEKNDDRLQEAELHRLKGELLLAESPDQTADRRGLLPPGHRDGPAPAEQGVGAAGHDEPRPPLAAAGPPRRGPPDALAAVHGTYTEGFTTPDLVEAGALLEALA